MGAFQYSGGVGASLARALASAGEGYQQGIDDRLRRAQQQAQTANIEAEQPNRLAQEAQAAAEQYGYDPEHAMNYVRYAHGLPPIPSSSPGSGPAAPPPAPVPLPATLSAQQFPNAPAATNNAPVPPPAPVAVPAVSARPPALPLANRVTQAFAPIVPPAPVRPMPPPLAQALTPIAPAPSPPAARPMPPPAALAPVPLPAPAPPQQAGPWNQPVNPQDVVNAGPAPSMPPDTAPPGYMPFDPRAPVGKPLSLRQSEGMWGGRKDIAALNNQPKMQAAFTNAMADIGILPTDDNATRAAKFQQQMSRAQGMGPDFVQMVINSGGYNATNKDTTGAQRVANLGTHWTNEDSTALLKANSYADVGQARIQSLMATAGLTNKKGLWYDAVTGAQIDRDQAQTKMDEARANLLGVQATELPKMDIATINLKGAQGAAVTENADTNRMNAGTKAAFTTAQIQHLASENGVDAARIQEIGDKDPAFVQNSIALRSAQDRLQKARSITDRTQRNYAINLAYQDINRLQPLVQGRLRGNGPVATPQAPVPQVPSVPMPGQQPPRTAAPAYTADAMKTIGGVTKPVSEWRQIYQQQTGKPAPF